MADWSAGNPVAPPGPCNPGAAPDPKDPKWTDFIRNTFQAKLIPKYFPLNVFPDDVKFECTIEAEYGDVITLPLEGANPGPWQADGGQFRFKFSPGQSEVWTRYKRIYPSIKFQKFQKVTIKLHFVFGNSWLSSWVLGGRYTPTLEYTFWIPVGDAWFVSAYELYTWRKSSADVTTGASVAVVPGLVSGLVSGEMEYTDPNRPQDKPVIPNPDDINRGKKPPIGKMESRRDGSGASNAVGESSVPVMDSTELFERLHSLDQERRVDENLTLVDPASIDPNSIWASSDELRRSGLTKPNDPGPR